MCSSGMTDWNLPHERQPDRERDRHIDGSRAGGSWRAEPPRVAKATASDGRYVDGHPRRRGLVDQHPWVRAAILSLTLSQKARKPVLRIKHLT